MIKEGEHNMLEYKIKKFEAKAFMELDNIIKSEAIIAKLFLSLKDKLPTTESVGDEAIVFKNEKNSIYFFMGNNNIALIDYNSKNFASFSEMLKLCFSSLLEFTKNKKTKHLEISIDYFLVLEDSVNTSDSFDIIRDKIFPDLGSVNLSYFGFKWTVEECSIQLGIESAESKNGASVFKCSGGCNIERFNFERVSEYLGVFEKTLKDQGIRVVKQILSHS